MRKMIVGVVTSGMAGVCLANAGVERSEGLIQNPGLLMKAQCIEGFSKDGCDGKIAPGDVFPVECPDQGCVTLYAFGSKYDTYLQSSPGSCGLVCDQKCDQLEKLSGKLSVSFDYMLALKPDCCPYRGCWEGSWTLSTEDGRVFSGEVFGTIGVGTNRKTGCVTPGPLPNDACESCYDVQLSDSTWLIGFEGAFRGYDEEGNSLCFTTDGTWMVKNTADGPAFKESIGVVSRFDGVGLFICQ